MHEQGRLLALLMQQLHTADPGRSFLGNYKMEAHFLLALVSILKLSVLKSFYLKHEIQQKTYSGTLLSQG